MGKPDHLGIGLPQETICTCGYNSSTRVSCDWSLAAPCDSSAHNMFIFLFFPLVSGQNYPGALCNVTYSVPISCNEVSSKAVERSAPSVRVVSSAFMWLVVLRTTSSRLP